MTPCVLSPNIEFLSERAEIAAPQLLGLLIYRYLPSEEGRLERHLVSRIVEVEAYRQDDPASHSFRGPTTRNRAMFGPPGLAYVYLIYGMHHCLNVVCGPQGVGDAILVRAAVPLAGIETIRRLRQPSADRPGKRIATDRLLSGPGSLCKGLGVRREHHDGSSLVEDGPLRLAVSVELPRGEYAGPARLEADTPRRIVTTPRIGITKAPEVAWRFVDAGSRSVSRSASLTVSPRAGDRPQGP